MIVTVLGCGGAGGVPMISQGWGACDPGNPRNRRRRPSLLVEEGETRILVDSGPDLREQLLDAGVRRLDAVLYTHAHADHTHGIDDLREVNRVLGGPLAVHGSAATLAGIRERFDYAFTGLEAGASVIYKPLLVPQVLAGPFHIGPVAVVPFEQEHGYGDSTGYRIGPIAYSTDVVELSEPAFAALAGVKLWIVGALTLRPHPTHAHLAKALAWIDRVKPERALITHMGPDLDYATVARLLPAHVAPAHDGLVIEV